MDEVNDTMMAAFDAGFNDADLPAGETQPQDTAEPQGEEAAAGQTEPAAEQVENPENTEPGNADEKAEEAKTKTFTQDELNAIVEKRLAKDRASQEKKLQAHPALSFLERKAAESGMSVDQLVENWERNDDNNRIREMAAREKIPVEVAERLYRAEKRSQQETRKASEAEAKTSDEVKTRQQFLDLVEAYPDLKAEDVPQEVFKRAHETGSTLVDAMNWHDNKRLKAEVAELKKQIVTVGKVQEKNDTNKKRAPIANGGVTVQGNAGGDEKDPFLIGWNMA